MDMGPVRAARWIDDRPHGADSQSIGRVISQLAAHHRRDRVDVLNQSRERDVLVQPDVAVPTPQAPGSSTCAPLILSRSRSA